MTDKKDHKLWDYDRRCEGQIFPLGKNNENPLTIWMHLELPYSARAKQLGESWWVESFANQKPSQDFSTPVNTKFCSKCHRLAIISMSNYALNLTSPCLGVWLGLGGRKWYQLKCQQHIPILPPNKPQPYLAPFSHNPKRDRQTESDWNGSPIQWYQWPKNCGRIQAQPDKVKGISKKEKLYNRIIQDKSSMFSQEIKVNAMSDDLLGNVNPKFFMQSLWMNLAPIQFSEPRLLFTVTRLVVASTFAII